MRRPNNIPGEAGEDNDGKSTPNDFNSVEGSSLMLSRGPQMSSDRLGFTSIAPK
tara:strand:- start:2338 stop:2499 length:162 start_codon:yes stop_codon:yes gene_type:complete